MTSSHIIFQLDAQAELRYLAESDAPALFRLIDTNRQHLRAWLPWIDSTRTVEDELAFIRYCQTEILNNQKRIFGIWYQGQITGTIGYNTISWANCSADIGYWLGADYQGKGLMTRACRFMVNYAFTALELNKIEIRCAVGNTRSCAIPRRLGFQLEGISRQAEWLYDHYVDLQVFSLLASEWPHHTNVD